MLLLILAVLLVAFVVETILTETENFGWATVTLIALGVASVVAGHWFHTYSVVDFVKDHGVWTLVYVVGYLVVGIAWSFAKWLSFLIGFRDTFRAEREKFLAAKGLPTGSALTEELQAEFIKGFGSEFRHGRGRVYDHSGNLVKPEGWIAETFEYRGNALNARPRATKNKTRITAWASFWPFSFVGTLLNDPVRRLFNFLFNWFKALYQQLADYVFRKDLELK